MKFIRVAIFLILSAFGLSACRENFSWNQKLTVTVETPLDERSGAAIVNERATQERQLLSGSADQYDIKDEATVVGVTPGINLFALLGEASAKELAMRFWREVTSEEQRRDPINCHPSGLNKLRNSRMANLWPDTVLVREQFQILGQ